MKRLKSLNLIYLRRLSLPGNSPQQGDNPTGKPTKEDFKKMTYTEQVELLNSDPDLYREL
ncbi:hypothetical protein ACVXZY_10680 [Staphylococcus aureus]